MFTGEAKEINSYTGDVKFTGDHLNSVIFVFEPAKRSHLHNHATVSKYPVNTQMNLCDSEIWELLVNTQNTDIQELEFPQLQESAYASL